MRAAHNQTSVDIRARRQEGSICVLGMEGLGTATETGCHSSGSKISSIRRSNRRAILKRGAARIVAFRLDLRFTVCARLRACRTVDWLQSCSPENAQAVLQRYRLTDSRARTRRTELRTGTGDDSSIRGIEVHDRLRRPRVMIEAESAGTQRERLELNSPLELV